MSFVSPTGQERRSSPPPKPPESDEGSGKPSFDNVETPPKEDIEANRSLEKMGELFFYCAGQALEIKDSCDEAVKVGKKLAVGIAGKHWLLQEATETQIDILLCTPTEKRPSFVKTIITSVISALDKNIAAMERVSFCPICFKPAPKSNACETCKQPTHLQCGGRMDGPEFYCDHCRDKGMAADKLADLKDANDIDPPPEDIQPGNIPDEPKDSTPPDNIPDKTKDTTNMPPPENRPPETKDTKDTKDNDGDADKETDDPPSVNPGVSELYDPTANVESFVQLKNSSSNHATYTFCSKNETKL